MTISKGQLNEGGLSILLGHKHKRAYSSRESTAITARDTLKPIAAARLIEDKADCPEARMKTADVAIHRSWRGSKDRLCRRHSIMLTGGAWRQLEASVGDVDRVAAALPLAEW